MTFTRNYFHYPFRDHISFITNGWKTSLQIRIQNKIILDIAQTFQTFYPFSVYHYLSFDLRLLITRLVSSNFSP
jgi:hypothetical protein